MSNIKAFEEKHLAVFQELQEVTNKRKNLEKQEKDIKASLEKAMEEYGVKQIDHPLIKITYIDESTSTSIDLKEMEKEEPELYEELLEDYPKVTTRRAHIRFNVK